MSEYYSLGPKSQFPNGEMRCVGMKGKKLLIANVDGQFYCVDEQCTHEDVSLCLGSLHGHLVSCSLHGSRFDVKTGQPVEEPADEPLSTYAVEVREDQLYVRLS